MSWNTLHHGSLLHSRLHYLGLLLLHARLPLASHWHSLTHADLLRWLLLADLWLLHHGWVDRTLVCIWHTHPSLLLLLLGLLLHL